MGPRGVALLHSFFLRILCGLNRTKLSLRANAGHSNLAKGLLHRISTKKKEQSFCFESSLQVKRHRVFVDVVSLDPVV